MITTGRVELQNLASLFVYNCQQLIRRQLTDKVCDSIRECDDTKSSEPAEDPPTEIQTLKFHNGHKMPVIGLGTGGEVIPRCVSDIESFNLRTKRAIDMALEVGYRHFDTHRIFGTEHILGSIFKKWIDCGKIIRNDLFISTKLGLTMLHPDKVTKSVCQSLQQLKTDYIDLLLFSHPVGLKERGDELVPTDECGFARVDLETDLKAVWQAMEMEVYSGRVRSIGLSNFNTKQICRILENACVKPSNLQIEIHLYFQQKQLVEFCTQHGITVTSFASLGAPHLKDLLKSRGINTDRLPRIFPMEDPAVVKIAKTHKKRPEQVLLRHLIQKNIAVIPKSFTPKRIACNFDVFDFDLSPSEIEELNDRDGGCRCRLYREVIKGTAKHPQWPFANECF